MRSQLLSPGGRPVTYLRVSVTDRCDMRCGYCMPAGLDFLPRDAYMTNDEITRVIAVAASMGVNKVRLTGGEPLVRSGIVDLVRHLAALPGIQEVALSTNGSKLERYALPLAAAGLRRVNVSLDTLDARQFAEITGGGKLSATLAGLDAAEQAGLTPLKVNAVIIRGTNEQQVPELVAMGVRRGWQVRFIEYMPIGCASGQWEERYISAPEILEMVQERFPLEPLPMKHGKEQTPRTVGKGTHGRSGFAPQVDPARIFRVAGSKASVGVITPVSQHFCDSCNRMRLTADGKIRSCLLVEGEADLRGRMRAGCTDDEIAEILRTAAGLKPEWHGMTPGNYSRATHAMREIGG